MADSGDSTRFDTRRMDSPEPESGLPGGDRLPVDQDLQDRYEVLRSLGAGGEAHRVLLARDITDGSLAVIKIYRQSIRRNDDVMRALGGARHRHVVRLLDHGTTTDQFGDQWSWEVLEYAAGGSLADLLRSNGPIAPDQVRLLLTQLIEALNHLHTQLVVGKRRGAAHRDLKPANVLLRSEHGPLEAVLADFGMVAEAGHTRHTDHAAGSAPYQAPETFRRASRSITQDWWALGIMVVEMLTGRNPNAVDGGWANPLALHEHLTTHPVDLDGVTDPRWRMLCQGLLTRTPAKRWGYEQVATWLRGGNPQVHGEGATGESRAPYWLAGERLYTVDQVADAMAAEAWTDVLRTFQDAKRLARLRDWLQREFNGGGIPPQLVREPVEDPRSAAVRMASFRASVRPQAAPRFAGRLTDAAGLSELAASEAGDDQAVMAVVSPELIGVFAGHACTTAGRPGHERCGVRCRVLTAAADALPVVEEEVRRTLADLRSAAEPGGHLARALPMMGNNKSLHILCLRSALDPATGRRLRRRLGWLRRFNGSLRACTWWMELSRRAVRERGSLGLLLVADVLVTTAEGDGGAKLREPGGRTEQRRERAMAVLGRTGMGAVAVIGDAVTSAVLFTAALAALYVAAVAWLMLGGDRPEPSPGKYVGLAADLQYTLAVPIAVALLAVLMCQRRPGPAAVWGGVLAVLTGALAALGLWHGHRRDVRFPYLPGADFRSLLLDLDGRAEDRPGATACWVAVAVVLLIGIVVDLANRRPKPVFGDQDLWWVRAAVVLAVLLLVVGLVKDWPVVPGFLAAAPQKLW
ncbi:serine/threonine-protein kinase [Streptomyces populi]